MADLGDDALLHHVTMHSRHVAETPRSAVDQVVVDHLLPLVDAGGGWVPGMASVHADLVRPQDQNKRPLGGAIYIQLGPERMSPQPWVQCFGCWERRESEATWKVAMWSYRQMRPALQKVNLWRDPPASPPPVPWLAVWLMPFIVARSIEDIGTFGDLERCLFWAAVGSEGK